MDTNGVVKGSVIVKAGRPSRRTSKSRTTVTVQMAGARRQTYSRRAVFDGHIVATMPDGRALDLTVGAESLSGTFGGFPIDGARNVFAAEDTESKERAGQAVKGWRGAYTAAWAGKSGWNGVFAKVGARGRTWVYVRTAEGARFTLRTQLLVGERECAVAVSWTRRASSGGCLVWFCEDGAIECMGIQGGIAARAPDSGYRLSEGSAFHIDASAVAEKSPGVRSDLLPDGIAVRNKGSRLVVDNAGDPSGLTLTSSAKACIFSGRFKVYTLHDGHQISRRAAVSGVVVDGRGYGTVVVRGLGTFPVSIE